MNTDDAAGAPGIDSERPGAGISPSGRMVILVYSTSHAVAIEKLLKARGIEAAMVPVPRHLSSDCGICVRIPAAAAEQARACVEESGIEIQGMRGV